MKPFKYATIIPLILFNFLYASEIKIPENIKIELCKKLNDGAVCDIENQLNYSDYFKQDDNTLLLFFNIYSKNSMYPYGYEYIPLILDRDKKFQIVDSMVGYGEIQETKKDPFGGLWLRTLWMIEGVSPSLYNSKDGREWKKIDLPENREVNSAFEDLNICLQENDIVLTFHDLDNRVSKSWKSSYVDAIGEEPDWQILEQNPNFENCYRERVGVSGWRLQEDTANRDIFFIHKEQNLTLKINKTWTPSQKRYSIQLGVFSNRSSIDKIKKMEGFSKFKINIRNLKRGDKTQYKLFLDSFESRKEAQEILKSLKESYQENKILQGAFVTKLP